MIAPTPHGYRHLRLGRRSIPRQLYLLTTVTWQRRPCFAEVELARFAARLLSSNETWAPSRWICWALMPDHLHALVELGDGSDLPSTMQRTKGCLARQAGISKLLNGKLWAAGFHDHALRKDESVHAVVRYIIANPVRAGLVRRITDYPYWDINLDGSDMIDMLASLDYDE